MSRIFRGLLLAAVALGVFGARADMEGAQDALALQTGAPRVSTEADRLLNRLSLRRSAAHDGLDWIIIRGGVVSFYYLPNANLGKIEKRLRNRSLPIAREYRDLFTNKAYPIESRISARLQFLLSRVEDILGMRPLIPSIDIKTLRNREDLRARCRQLMGGQADYKSFYVHSLSTIFASEKDIVDSIIAHEMAHAVMDHYFMVPPPSMAAELLAIHVDEHLERDD